MATEYFSVKHSAGLSVYFRFFDPSDDTVFDFDDDTWKANLAACVDPKLAATEKTDMGDADESLYVASYDLATIYNTATPKQFVVQAVDDLATDEVIAEGETWIVSGLRWLPSWSECPGTADVKAGVEYASGARTGSYVGPVCLIEGTVITPAITGEVS